MDEELVFRILFISIYAVFAGVRIYYRSQNIGRTSEKEYTQKTKAITVLIVAILGYFLTVGLWIVFPPIVLIFQIPLPSVIRWFGGGIALIATALTVWIHRILGKQYSAKLEIQKGHELITVGPYSKIRHPMYSSLNLFSLSVSLISANLLLILFAISVAIPFHWITRAEEELLIEQFGEEYLEYMQTTGRFFPRLW
ncbi:MAG: isoprenylcysteine carboxylmethyltransferase family protein [Candidatus Heimdallarchaeota archaeon]|nr:MAG: isoprenylcysteine carboxylmethyltransferase family protein [Candidatus Heimdallarchaeota archaeon]